MTPRTGSSSIVGGQTLEVRPTDPARTEEVAAILAEVTGSRVESPRRGTLSVSVPDDSALPDGCDPSRRGRHHRHRVLPSPAQPGRGVLHPHRAQRKRRRVAVRDQGGSMTATLSREPTVVAPTPPASRTEPPRSALIRHSVALARRSLIKTWRTPEALIDVTLQPMIFLLLFTYIFGGAISGGSQHDYLQFLLPGLLGQSIAMAGISLGTEPQRRPREGRLRPVPIAADRPFGPAGRRCARRRGPLPDPVRGVPRLRVPDRFPDRDQRDRDDRRSRDCRSRSPCASAGSRCGWA